MSRTHHARRHRCRWRVVDRQKADAREFEHKRRQAWFWSNEQPQECERCGRKRIRVLVR